MIDRAFNAPEKAKVALVLPLATFEPATRYRVVMKRLERTKPRQNLD